MPVIGRLDGQVEEVIIKPVGRRHDAPGGTDAPDSASDSSTRPRDEPRAARPENRPGTSRDERRGDAELPVWLL
jgi:hypothetical protein